MGSVGCWRPLPILEFSLLALYNIYGNAATDVKDCTVAVHVRPPNKGCHPILTYMFRDINALECRIKYNFVVASFYSTVLEEISKLIRNLFQNKFWIHFAICYGTAVTEQVHLQRATIVGCMMLISSQHPTGCWESRTDVQWEEEDRLQIPAAFKLHFYSINV